MIWVTLIVIAALLCVYRLQVAVVAFLIGSLVGTVGHGMLAGLLVLFVGECVNYFYKSAKNFDDKEPK